MEGVTFVKNINEDDGTVSKILLSIHVDDAVGKHTIGRPKVN